MESELPVVFLRGDKTGIQLYSAADDEAGTVPLCEPISFDELIQLSRGDPGASVVLLNTNLPRVRDLLEKSCLVRPGDEVLTVHKGFQERKSIVSFAVHSDAPVCPNDSPYSLWGVFDAPLEQEPLFFSTDPSLPEALNAYAPLTFEPAAADVRARLKNLLPFSEEFELRQSSGLPTRLLVHARRRVIRLEDKGLASEVLFSLGDQVEEVWRERVDPEYGSGTFAVLGMFDMDGNGILDMHMAGVHQGCPYQMFFIGTETGFSLVPMPRRPCRC